MKRRNIKKEELNVEKINILVRFMIVAAENKRFVEYNELNKVLGISLEDLRDYAGFLGDYCSDRKLPFLNSLIINASEGRPGEDFYNWAECGNEEWGLHVSDCFRRFHLPQDNKVRFQNTTGIDKSINSFLDK